jgi:hypothetical protein
MDDVDAERCRDGRAYYPNFWLFVLIAIPIRYDGDSEVQQYSIV